MHHYKWQYKKIIYQGTIIQQYKKNIEILKIENQKLQLKISGPREYIDSEIKQLKLENIKLKSDIQKLKTLYKYTIQHLTEV